jgi:hypothetical protein
VSDSLPAARKFLAQIASWAKDAQQDSAKLLWGGMHAAFNGVFDDYERLQESTRPVPASYGDISDLPASLRRELAFLRTDELDDQIFIIVKAAPNGADLDIILIELFRRFGVAQTRRFIQNKTYRMAGKGLIFAVDGRKGMYAATEEEARRISPLHHADDDGPATAPAMISDFSNLDEAEGAPPNDADDLPPQ